jgi:hypothetical protein
LARMIGMIVSAKVLRLQLLWFLNPALDELVEATKAIDTCLSDWTATVSVSTVALQRVTQLVHWLKANPRPLWSNPRRLVWLSTDATMEAIGAAPWDDLPDFLVSTAAAKEPVDLARCEAFLQKPRAIVEAEAWAIPWALKLWGPRIQGMMEASQSVLDVFVDNQAACASFQKGRSKTKYIQHIIDEFMEVSIKLGISCNFQWIPTKQNYWADYTTRATMDSPDYMLSAWQLDRFLLWVRTKGLPIPTVEALSRCRNYNFPRFMSMFKDTDSCGSFFSTPLQGLGVFWVNPRFTRSGKHIRKCLWRILEQRVPAWVLLPVWTSHAWFQHVKDAKASFTFNHLPSHPLFTNLDGSSCVQPTVTKIIACYFEN